MTPQDWIRAVLAPLEVDDHTLSAFAPEVAEAADWYSQGTPGWTRLYRSLAVPSVGTRSHLAHTAVALHNQQPVTHTLPQAWGLWQLDVDKLSRWLGSDQRQRLLVLIDQVLETRSVHDSPPGFRGVSDGRVRRRDPHYQPEKGDIVKVRNEIGWIGALVTAVNGPEIKYAATGPGFPTALRVTPEQGWVEPLQWIVAMHRGATLWRCGPLLPGHPPFRTRLKHVRGLVL